MKISKRSQQKPYIPTPNVIIEPIDPLVQMAVNKIKQRDPNFFMQVEKQYVNISGEILRDFNGDIVQKKKVQLYHGSQEHLGTFKTNSTGGFKTQIPMLVHCKY